MRELETIQTKEKLNKVFAVDEAGPGGASHAYSIRSADTERTYLDVFFQKGARKEAGSQHGVIDSDLLEIVKDRLTAFQEGQFANKYNEAVLYHIDCALILMNKRIEDRIERNVLGNYEK